MPRNGYNRKLGHKEILSLVDDGLYFVDLDAGKVWSTTTKLEIFKFKGGKDTSPRKWIRIYYENGHRAMPVAHLIWIVGTRSAIPAGFQIYHRDLNVENDAFLNLFALHSVDHRKLHNRELVVEEPF